MSIEKKIFAVKNCNYSNLGKRWFLKIKVLDFNKGGFTWRKLYADINKYNTVEDRQIECLRLIDEIQATGQYITNQGSRIINPHKEDLFYTHTILQVKNALEKRRIRVRQSTFSKYKGQIKVFENYLQKNNLTALPLGQFSNDIATDFLSQLVLKNSKSNNTYNSYLQLLKSIFSSFVRDKKIIENPFENIAPLPKQSKPAPYFKDWQIEKIKAAVIDESPQLWLFIQFIYYCFIRPKELRLLQLKHINFEAAQIFVPSHISKNGKNSYVTIPQALFCQIKHFEWLCLDSYLFAKNGAPGLYPVSVNWAKTEHKKIMLKLDFSEDYKLYGWKHTGAIKFARGGGLLKDLQLQLRHHSLEQVNTYLQGMGANESEFIKNSFPIL